MAKKLNLTNIQSILLGDTALEFEGKPDQQWHALLEHAENAESLVCIDWREEPVHLVTGLEKMLARHAATQFDWSFLDHLADLAQGEVLRNNNLLSHIRDQLVPHGLRLVHLDMQDDAFRCFIATAEDFASIEGMGKQRLVAISDDFGADEYYELGRMHLASIGFSQPAADAKQGELARKRQKRRLLSIEKMLDDDANEPPGKPAHARPLVPEDTQFNVPTQLDQETSAWTAYLAIGWHTNWVFARAAKRIREGESNWGSALVDGFKLRLLEHLFLERAYLEALVQQPPTGDPFKGISLFDAGRYLELTQSAAAFHYLGYADEWRQCVDLFRLFDLRFDLPGKAEPEMEPMQLSLIAFLNQASPGAADLNALAGTAPFGPFFGTWDNDAYFTQALDALCEWHLASCHAVLRGDNATIHSSGMDFFPVWLLAIDRHREQALGRSCLPQNDLIERAQPYIHARYDGAEHAFVGKVRALYERSYANRPVNFVEEWTRYMQRAGEPAPEA